MITQAECVHWDSLEKNSLLWLVLEKNALSHKLERKVKAVFIQDVWGLHKVSCPFPDPRTVHLMKWFVDGQDGRSESQTEVEKRVYLSPQSSQNQETGENTESGREPMTLQRQGSSREPGTQVRLNTQENNQNKRHQEPVKGWTRQDNSVSKWSSEHRQKPTVQVSVGGKVRSDDVHIIHSSLNLSCFVSEQNHIETCEHRTDWTMAAKTMISIFWVRLFVLSCCRKSSTYWGGSDCISGPATDPHLVCVWTHHCPLRSSHLCMWRRGQRMECSPRLTASPVCSVSQLKKVLLKVY